MISDFKFQISDLRQRISEFNLKSEICNLKFRRRRTGVTILEVLFAIMVTTIGLLGALTLLPVAATQARKARTADASTSAVTAAVGFFDARGMRKPQNWIAYDLTNGTPRFPWAEFQAYQQNPVGPQPPIRKNWFGGFDSFCIDPRMTAANQVERQITSTGSRTTTA